MEEFKKIIEKGKVDLSVSTVGFFQILTPIFLIVACTFGMYKMNIIDDPERLDQPVAFYNVLFPILILLLAWIVLLSIRKLKTIAYPNSNPVDRKAKAVEKVASDNKWKLKKKDMNYYFFWENNWIFRSYYITIVFDENSFHINSYPSLNKIIDFGASERNSNEVYRQIEACL